MVAVYYKGCLHQTFNSLVEAEKYVHERLENDSSESPENWEYMFY